MRNVSALLAFLLVIPSSAAAAKITLKKQSRRSGYQVTVQDKKSLLDAQNARLAAAKQPIEFIAYRSATLGISTMKPKAWLSQTTSMIFAPSTDTMLGSAKATMQEVGSQSAAKIIVTMALNHPASTADALDATMSKNLNYDIVEQKLIHPDGSFIHGMTPVITSDVRIAGYAGRQYLFSAGSGKKSTLQYILLPVEGNLYTLLFSTPIENTASLQPIFEKFLENAEFFPPKNTAPKSPKK